MNKWLITGVMLSLSLGSVFAADRVPENGFGIVPMPYEAKSMEGNPFVITQETVLIGRGAETKNCAAYLQQRIRKSCGLKLSRRGTTKGKAIVLKVSDDAVAFSENDAYRLESSADKITISAKTERGLFYGVQSLLQLLPPAVYGDTIQAGLELKVPALVINDKPSMDRIRGLHVDISRHFRTKEELLLIIDSMAMHKLNTLHLHATDVQGWRIEIKAYPKLTTVGAIGNKSDPEAPATFLTQEEVKEICAYARSRYISIFPEIDMPGHMGAAIRAYPELNHPKDVNDKKYAIRGDAMGRDFAKTVLTEINELFDAEYIHIGFDEVNYGAKAELYTDAELLDFVKDITTFIKDDLKKTPIVWDDIFMHGFDDKESIVQWWRYGKNYWWKRLENTVDEELNQRQQPFILSPAYWTYFDMKNLKGGWAKPLSVAEVYNWDPYGDMLGKTEHTRELAVGAIACTWSEKIPTMQVFGDRTYPRLACFSERIWRGGKEEAPNILSWPEYRDQVLIPFQLKRYEALGLHYWSKDNPKLLLELPDNHKKVVVKPQGIAGPLMGDIKPDGVTLWMYAPAKSQCTFNYHAEESSLVDKKTGTFTSVQDPAANGPGRVFKSPLVGLLPDTHYRYQVSVDGKSNPAWEGSFKTAPVEGKPAAFRLAITSCMRIGQPQDSWNLLLAEQPDLHITVGDTHYADTTDPTVQLKHHVTYRREKEFAKVLRRVPIYAIWDDHDYGPNNSDGTAKGKEFSLAGWEQAWANPELGTTDTPGAFFKFSHGDVDFFVVDGRYHRSPNEVPDDENKRMLGDAQFEWLLEGLKSSKARFKIIASGSTLHHSKVDGWRIYTFSRHRLFDAIKENQISGVMYLSGDMHRSLVWEHHESDRVGYPMVEVMSSGIAQGRDLSFATIDFDTTRDDPTARVRIIFGNGRVHTDKTWKLSQLGHKRNP